MRRSQGRRRHLGGANAGDVNFPKHMLAAHKALLSGAAEYELDTEFNYPVMTGKYMNVVDELANAMGQSPYVMAEAHDPEPALEKFKQSVEYVGDFAESIPDLTDIVGAVSSGNALDTSHVQALLDAHEEQSDRVYAEEIAKFKTAMSFVGASLTSQLPIGISLIEGRRQTELAEVATKALIDAGERHYRSIVSAAEVVVREFAGKAQFVEAAARAQGAVANFEIVAKNDEVSGEMFMRSSEEMWNLELFKYGAQVMSSIGGGAVLPTQPAWERIMKAGIGVAGTALNVSTGAASMAMGGLSSVLGIIAGW